MRIVQFAFCCALTLPLLLAGCKTENIRTKDGIIPSDYLEAIRPYLGSYQGQFHYTAGYVNVSLDNQNRLIVKFTDQDGNNGILWPSCRKEIGPLEYIRINPENPNLVEALYFAFDGNNCLGTDFLEIWPTVKDTTIELTLILRPNQQNEGYRDLPYRGEFSKPK